MSEVKLISETAMNDVVSKLEPTNQAVWKETKKITNKAKRLLGQHRQTGEAQIEITFGDTDGHITLADPAALSIEFGHFVKKKDGTVVYVPGLYVLRRAAGLM